MDPVCLTNRDFEKEFMFTQYIETQDNLTRKTAIDIFLSFLDKLKLDKIFTFLLYDGEITDVVHISLEKIRQNLELEYENRGIFYNDDICVSKMFSDCKSFYIIPEQGIVFFAGSDEATDIMKTLLAEFGLKFTARGLKNGYLIKGDEK